MTKIFTAKERLHFMNDGTLRAISRRWMVDAKITPEVAEQELESRKKSTVGSMAEYVCKIWEEEA